MNTRVYLLHSLCKIYHMLNIKNYYCALGVVLVVALGCDSSQSKKEENTTPADTLATANKDTVQLPEPYATKSSINFSDVKEWPQGQTPTAPAGFTVTKFADTLRNPRWIYIGPNGDIFVAESSTKTGDIKTKIKDVVSGKNKSENTEGSANRITLFRDSDHNGWPYAYFGPHEDPRLKGQAPDMVKKTVVPDVSLGAHTASLGLAFDEKNILPGKYKGGAFIGQHGSWNRSRLAGYKVAFVPFKDGKPTGRVEDFLTGFVKGEDEVYGRPVGVAFTPDGSLLVADDAGNTIWRVTASK